LRRCRTWRAIPGRSGCQFATRAAAHAAIFEWIEVFYNRGGSTAPSAIIPLWTLKPNLTKNTPVSCTHYLSTKSGQDHSTKQRQLYDRPPWDSAFDQPGLRPRPEREPGRLAAVGHGNEGGKTQGQLNLSRGRRTETVRAPVKDAFALPLGLSKASSHTAQTCGCRIPSGGLCC